MRLPATLFRVRIARAARLRHARCSRALIGQLQ
jgi:hypothetical protein